MVGYLSDPTREYLNNRTEAVLGENFDPNNVKLPSRASNVSVGSPYGTINDAIAKRSSDKFYDPQQIDDLRKLQQIQNRGSRLKNLGANLNRQYQLDNAAANAMQQRAAQEEAQRNAILGSVLGVGLTVAGGAFGGPIGAGAGAAVSQGINSNNQTRSQPYTTSSGYNTSGRVPQRQLGGY